MPTSLRIRLPDTTEEEFISRYREHLSRGGIFIVTRSPKAEGSVVVVDLVLQGGERVLRGEAVVLKVRGEGQSAPPGMMLRFRALDARSKTLVEALASARLAGLPHEVEVPLEFTGEAPAPDAALEPIAASVGTNHSAAPEPDPAPVRATFPTTEMAAQDGVEAQPRLPEYRIDTRPDFPALTPTPAFPSEPGSERLSEPTSEPVGEPAREAPTRRRMSMELPVPGAPAATPIALGLQLDAYRVRVAQVRSDVGSGSPTAQLLALDASSAIALPSAVAVSPDGKLLLGWEAARSPRPWYGWTRGIGLPADAPFAQQGWASGPFQRVVGAQGDASWQLGDYVVSARMLARDLLIQVRAQLVERLESPALSLVLCVPAHFGHRQRSALWGAASDAGFHVLRLVQSTCAAALAVGHGRGLPRKRILVCDLGAGSTNAAVIELTGNELELVSSVGDPALGGLELDAQLESQLGLSGQSPALEARPSVSPEAAPGAWPGAWIEALAQAKTALETAEVAELALSSLPHPVSLTRSALDQTLQPHTDAALAIARTALEEAGLQSQGLDEVVLFGENAHAPSVRRQWEAALEKAPQQVDRMEGIAVRGAALLAHALTRAGGGPPFAAATEVLTRGIEVAVEGSGVQRIFDRRTHLPAEKTLELSLESGQSVRLAFLQRRSDSELEYAALATFRPERKGTFVFRLALDASAQLQLSVQGPAGAAVQPLVLDSSVPLPPELMTPAVHPAAAEGRGGLLGGIRRLWKRG